MKNKITVVIVTYNGSRWIEKCLTSLKASNCDFETIIVDNFSTDETVRIAEKFEDVQIIKSEQNLGFGKANNIGIKKALENGAEFVFLLNQDTWVYEDTIADLVAVLESKSEFGIISPLHFSADEQTLDENFSVYYNRKTQNEGFVSEVPFVNAAAWMVSKYCFEKVGFFEPVFSHYGEDRNFCDRVKFHGFKIGITDNSKICHDRVIVRNNKKDLLQSQYKILITFLDVNLSLFKASIKAMKEVVGLPKYFFKRSGFRFSLKLLIQLKMYYLKTILNLGTIKTIRKNSKLGINGK